YFLYKSSIFLLWCNASAVRQLQTLLTQTPEEGFALAVELAQIGIVVTQPSEEIRKVLRPTYSRNADSLTAAFQVIAIHFQTVAAANNYWRPWPSY
ncbi:hexameric tyrosine-coordinated heme protein, partial [Sporosarcina sp. OR05]|uniref:hexameric tyrosine-coordinated heme protein n=1 Tax=Sporosarcina sp. OR05 TaxID=2969819 RepID=UPI003529DBC2